MGDEQQDGGTLGHECPNGNVSIRQRGASAGKRKTFHGIARPW
jgi:hypothetical protein